MMYPAGDLSLLIDFGNSRPGSVLQRQSEGQWRDFLVDGEQVVCAFDESQLPPGEYRLKSV